MRPVPFFLLLALASPAAVAWMPEDPARHYVEGEVLVKYRSGPGLAKSRLDLGLTPRRAFERLRIEHLRLPAYLDVEGALQLLRADPAVEYAEPNFLRVPRTVIPGDPLFGEQWGLHNTGQPNFVAGGPAGVPGGDLNLTEAWDGDGDGVADRTGDPDVIVAIIDDSFSTGHPDLAGRIVPGYDFACGDNDPRPQGDDFHGTPVAGCAVGAGGNGVGIAGVAWQARLMPLRFAFDQAGHIAALEFAREHGASIINASFGGPGYSQAERDAITALAADGIVYVAAAGNDDSNTDIGQINYPANYDADNIIAVAATNRQDNIASFSQYGPLTTDVAAPGLQVVSTATGEGYTTRPGVSGTSFAAPYVAGVAALLKSHVSPTPDHVEIKARLIESGSAVDGANPRRRTVGGRVDADRALEMTPRPSLVIQSVAFSGGDGNHVLDPGETLDVDFVLHNLWQSATNVVATLVVDNGIVVNTPPVEVGTVTSGGGATASFSITVPDGIEDHRYVDFSLELTADDGYTAVRHYAADLGALQPGTPVQQPFADDLYDEFHAWHVDVPAAGGGSRTLVIRTGTDAALDIDLLVRDQIPPQYNITVGANPESPGFFCTSGTTADCQDPGTLISARLDGNEAVTIVNPVSGTWHLVVVNFVQKSLSYDLRAEIVPGDLRPDPFSLGVRKLAFRGSVQTSDTVTVSGIDAPTFITVAGGEYRINGGAYTDLEGTVVAGDRVQLRTTVESSSNHRAQLTIGGVTSTFLVNPRSTSGGSQFGQCGLSGGGGGSRLGAPDGWLLGFLVLAALHRRRRSA